MSAPNVYTCLYVIKLNFDSNCVYLTSHIVDALIFLSYIFYNFTAVGVGMRGGLPYICQLIFGFILLAMGIFAIFQLVTKNTSAASRQAQYTQYRLYTIIAFVVFAIIIFALFVLTFKGDGKVGFGISAAVPLLIDALILHGSHANFSG